MDETEFNWKMITILVSFFILFVVSEIFRNSDD